MSITPKAGGPIVTLNYENAGATSVPVGSISKRRIERATAGQIDVKAGFAAAYGAEAGQPAVPRFAKLRRVVDGTAQVEGIPAHEHLVAGIINVHEHTLPVGLRIEPQTHSRATPGLAGAGGAST